MAFKMKGSAFKLGNVATKSALQQKSPMKNKGDAIFEELDRDMTAHEIAVAKAHDKAHSEGGNALAHPKKSPNEMKSPIKQASPMKVAGGVFGFDPADETQKMIQIPTGKANMIEKTRDNLSKVVNNPNSTDKQIRQAERRLEGLMNISYSGINAYTDPNSDDFIPELKGANREQVFEWMNKNVQDKWSDDNTGGYRAKNPEQQKLWEDMREAIDFESTEMGEEETRRQEMLDKKNQPR